MLELFTIPKELYAPFFDTISMYRLEVEFNVKENGILIATFDTPKNQMIKTTLKIKPLEQCSFKLSINPLIKLAPKNDAVFYKSDGYVHVKIGTDATHNLRTLDDRLKDVSTAEEPTKFVHECNIALNAEITKSIVEAMRIANSENAQRVDFIVKEGNLAIHTKASEEHNIDVNVGAITGPDCASSFSSEYIAAALKHAKLFETITLSLGHDIPCIFDMKSPLIDTKILVSPRMDRDPQ